MTAQEIYDKVKKHLLEQNAKSTINSVTCAYRGTDGKKCAIGCLIADEDYRANYESIGVDSLPIALKDKLLPTDRTSDAGILFLHQLQHIHDRNGVEYWRSELMHLAQLHQLKP